MTTLQLGVAKVDITPITPVPLAGFAHRIGVSQGIAHPLHLRTFLFEREGRQLLLISADLIWWGPEIVAKLRGSIAKTWGIPPEHVLLHATHNHSGPQTSSRFTASLGRCDAAYLAWLEDRVHKGIRMAIGNVEPVHIQVGRGEWNVGIHRRRIVDGECVMAPNPEGPNDPSVTVIRFCRASGAIKGILVHATCHPTTTDDTRISSEFPGVAMDQLEAYLGPEIVSGYLQGFCGDVRPALAKDGMFLRGTNEDVERIGGALAATVMRTLSENSMQDVEHATICSETITVSLPVRQIPSLAELRAARREQGIRAKWASLLLSEPHRLQKTVPLELTAVRLAEGLGFIAANAEMVVEYGLYLKSQVRGCALPLGYTNGMIGYVPTARQIREGGYEAVDSCYYFALPSPFSETIEENIREKLDNLGKGCFS